MASSFKNYFEGKISHLKSLEVAGAYFNNRRKMAILNRDLDSSDIIHSSTESFNLFTLEFWHLVKGLFRLNMAESDEYFSTGFVPFSAIFVV